MKTGRSFFIISLYTGIGGLLLTLLSWSLGWNTLTGPVLIVSLILLAVGFQGIRKLKSFSYTTAIFAAVAVSMFYPQYFTRIGNFQLKLLIVPLLQIIMFGMGSQLSLKDFIGVIKMPKGVIVGLVCQFTIMPIVGITIARAFGFPAEIAAGIVLVGSAPSGLASNVMNFIAKANVPLSVTITAFATLLSPLMTPTLMKLLAGQFVPVDFWKMMFDIINMVILPVVAGLIFNAFAYRIKPWKKIGIELTAYFLVIVLTNLIVLKTSQGNVALFTRTLVTNVIWFILLPVAGGALFRKFTGGKKELLDNALSFISMAGIGIIITIITAAGRESLLQIGLILILATFIHNIGGYFLGYWLCRLIRMDEKSCRTVAIEVGMQNAGLASGIALEMGKVATIGLAPAVFGPLMNITGSSGWMKNLAVR